MDAQGSATGGQLESSQPAQPGATQLRPGALSLLDVIMQAITHIGPAIGIATSIAFIASLTGITSPLAYLFAFLLVLAIAISLTQLAKNFPSAGGYYTYISRTIHPRAGLLTAWIFFLYDPLGGTINMAFMGFILQGLLKGRYNVSFPWWITFLILLAVVTTLIYFGIQLSTRTLVVLGLLEIGIILALALTGLVRPGPGGTTLHPFNPANSISGTGLYLAIIFSILTFSGFESVAPLAEETRHPRRNLPIAIVGSVVFMGVFFVIASWGIVSGFGTNSVGALATAAQNPVVLVAEKLWTGAYWIVVLAILNSAIAVAIASANSSTRVFYAMGRSGSLPKQLTKLSPHATPVNAIILQTIISLVFGLGVGIWIGADQEFYVTGTFIALGLIFIYGIGNIGVTRYYAGELRREFNVFLHGIFPIGSLLLLLWVGYKSLVPFPTGDVKWAPIIFAVWLVLGIIFVWAISRTGREEWLAKSTESMYERRPSPGEAPHV